MDHMMFVVSLLNLLYSGSMLAFGDSQCCSRMLNDAGGNSGVTSPSPPQIYGEWVSMRCEVRPGPEFLARKYKFHADSTFTLFQYYYADNHCTTPLYSLKLRGSIQIDEPSWIIRGGTKAEYELDRVLVTSHRVDITEFLVAKVNATCPGFISPQETWVTNMRYHVFSWHDDKDCLEALSFSMHELQLLRVEIHERVDPKTRSTNLREELFLGDVHTDIKQRMYYRPTSYQTPLMNIKQQDNCSVCQLLDNSDDVNPPIFPAQSEYPVILHGEWVSSRCEVRPQVFFLIRHLIFHGNHTWEGYYHHYSDPFCRNPTFSLYAKGYHSEGLKSDIVRGGTEYDFITTEMRITPKDTGTTELLNVFEGDELCGQQGTWKLGTEQDVTQTYGCAALGIRLPHTEYELMRMEYDAFRRTVLLYNGQRPSDGSNPTTADKRPTSYQTPLVQCGGINILSRDSNSDSSDNDNSLNSAPSTPWQHVALATLLLNSILLS